MQLRLTAGTALVAFVLGGCGSSSSSDDSGHGAAGMSAMDSSGGTSANTTGGTTSDIGQGAAGGSTSTGGTTSGAGGSDTTGGSSMGAASGMSAMDSGSGGMPAAGSTGASGGGRMNGASGAGAVCASGMGCAGRATGRGGSGAGGQSASGGGAGDGLGGASSGGDSSGVNPNGGFAGAIMCPGHGQVVYTLRKDSNPTSDEQNAYDLITTAMDRAVQYYNCYTNITKAETVVYEPSVATADGNINGTIRFGQTEYMEYITAMHEISHTVGIGTDSHWPSLVVNGIFTGQHATDQLRAITGNATDQLNADTQHFWPYGLNYTSEVHSEADLVHHCLMVVAIRWDEGYDPE
ncbi:MAG TPA: hypothetical protein VMI54_03135 [Polyangiaceae bacterium]|nr:hypothetical protein [Polyangiaceae bacterium]